MSLLNNLSMRGKLVTLVLPALLVILFFAIQNISRNLDTLTDMQEFQAMARLAELGDPLVATLQRERGRSAIFLSTYTDSDEEQPAATALASQRRETDQTLQQYLSGIEALTADSDFDATISRSIEQFRHSISKLAELRRAIDARALANSDSVSRYSGLIMQMIERVPLLVRRASDPAQTRQISAYFSLALAAEMAGRERAVGAGVIESGGFELPTISGIANLWGQQNAFFQSAIEMLPGESDMRAKLERFADSPENQNFQAQRTTLFSNPSGMYSLNANDWFSAATQRIQSINQIRGELLATLDTLANEKVSEARTDLISAGIISLVAILVVILLMAVIIRAISLQVSSLLDGVRHARDEKDLSRTIPVSSKDETGTIAQAINELFGRFSDALLQIDKAAVQLATSTEETSSTAGHNATQVKGQQQQIEQVAAATEEMTATSEEISQNTLQVADASSRAMERSRTGEAALRTSVSQIHSLAASVQEVNQVITELEARSSTISDVVDVIRKVADQTNLLALNAAIEAARAGEHGRGFAVVADEVRTLAQQTHESTTRIEEIINGFRDITDSASSSISASHRLATETSEQTAEMEKTFAEIITDVNSISDMATQIATASEQQVAVTRELAGSMESVSEVAILTLTGSQEITQVTQEQARLARQLQDLANEFRVAD
ncbi:chemotaxis protein [Marinobacter fuscus]|uniref:Chemotaxis protein n=1 Tax=Marinobacter fuscus TaxID=2109942 RepID=A0A2T1KAK2_9GAMM|nr:methyl-accepting chemotaxis protein [Marinobacter fuscus]PSF07156.1 chemotaxis protein [Marinobacter fuscus]